MARSFDDHHTLQEFRASLGAQWTVLSDTDRTVQKDFDIGNIPTRPTPDRYSSALAVSRFGAEAKIRRQN